jgi:nitroreductase
MDILESVDSRMSIRAFKPDPVPKKVLQEIMDHALRAPSWANTQPWDFFIATGAKLAEIQENFLSSQTTATMEIARPQSFPELYSKRRLAPTVSPQTSEGKTLMNRNYGAPSVIYICTGRDLYFQSNGNNAWAIFDCGLIAENIMLLATNYGLGTVAQTQAVAFPDVLRKVLGIPDSLVIIIGISIGYPDWQSPANQRRSPRVPANENVKWLGF